MEDVYIQHWPDVEIPLMDLFGDIYNPVSGRCWAEIKKNRIFSIKNK